MLTSAEVLNALATWHGIVSDTAASRDDDLVLRGPAMAPTAYQVTKLRGPLRPWIVEQLAASTPAGARLLVLADGVTPHAAQVAAAAGVSVINTDSNGELAALLVDASGVAHELLRARTQEPVRLRRPGRVPWGTYAVAFALLEEPARTQVELAARVGLTRARVTQVLEVLGDLVERSAQGWAVRDRRDLAAWLVERYPSTPRLAMTWAMLEPPVPAAALVVGHLERVGVRHALSGDVAADFWAAWARPGSVWLWSDSLVDLGAVGATPAGPESATVTVAVSDDPYLLESVRRNDEGVPLLSPWRVWVDLVHAGNVEAADALLGRLTR